jgi:hypothetical protein
MASQESERREYIFSADFQGHMKNSGSQRKGKHYKFSHD